MRCTKLSSRRGAGSMPPPRFAGATKRKKLTKKKKDKYKYKYK